MGGLETLLAIWLFATGLAIGSFLNVVIVRLPADESLVRPRSRCPRCGHQLAWYENVPVLSWLGLRGRCSSCRAPISAQYPLVELLTGVLFMACLSRFGWGLSLAIALTFVSVLLPLVFIDARHWILPDELTAPGIAALLALQLLGGSHAFTTALIGAAVAFLVFRVMELLGWAMMGREALGAGDKNLMAVVGAALGWRPLLGVILLSSLQGAIYGVSRRALTGRAGPPVAEAEPGAPEQSPSSQREPWTPAFLRPGLPAWRRLMLVPYALLIQDIPDPPPPDEAGEEPEWIPSVSSMPFGPWIGLAGLEVLLLGPWLTAALAGTPWELSAGLLFGG